MVHIFPIYPLFSYAAQISFSVFCILTLRKDNYDVIAKCLAPQTVTGMVSLFFRQLPQPLIPYVLYLLFFKFYFNFKSTNTRFKDCMQIGAMTNEQDKIEGKFLTN